MAIVNGYTDLATMKEWFELDAGDTELDSLIESAVNAASRGIDNRCHRHFFSVTETRTFTFPLIAGITLLFGTYSDLSSFSLVDDDGTDVTADVVGWPENRQQGEVWPMRGLTFADWSGGAVEVTGDWGWPAIPETIGEAAVLQAARLVKRRKSPEGVVGVNQFGAVRMGRLDPDVKSMVRPYRMRSVG